MQKYRDVVLTTCLAYCQALLGIARYFCQYRGVAPDVVTLTNQPQTGDCIKRRRQHLGKKQDQLGPSKAVISKIENGNQDRVRVSTIEAIRRDLEWPSDWLERVDINREDLTEWRRAVLVEAPAAPETQLDRIEAGVSQLLVSVQEMGALRQAVRVLQERALRDDETSSGATPDDPSGAGEARSVP